MPDNSKSSTSIKLCSRIDRENAETVKEEIFSSLSGKEAGRLILDAEDLSYISSAGLRLILQLRKRYPECEIINVRPEVYDILSTTGFTEMMKVEKAYRRISVEGCDVIGEGSNGIVYRIDNETVVKIYKYDDALPAIRKERELARLALILDVPTAISYDVVRVNDRYGAVFELLDARSFAGILAEEPEKMDWCVKEHIDLLKFLHKTPVPDQKLPSINKRAQEWLGGMLSCLPYESGQKLKRMMDAVPERDTMIHGDYHAKNIVLSGGEVLLIDMDTLSTGHPIFELAQMYCCYLGFYELQPELIKGYMGFGADTAREFWRRSLAAYLDTEDADRIDYVQKQIRCVAYVRLIDWSLRHKKSEDEEAAALRDHWLQSLTKLLDEVDTLRLDERDEDRSLTGEEQEIPVTVWINDEEWIRKIDLHIHSTASDGTDSPERIIAGVRKAGVPLFSVTDHDSVKGCRIVRDSLQKGDPHFVVGVEFSCKDEEGKYHILGYGFDPDDGSIQKLIEIGHANRIRKVRGRLDYLKQEYEIAFPDEVISSLYSMDSPGKPHIGNLMVKYGFSPTLDAAISTMLNTIHIQDDYLQPENAVIGILAAGGIPVLAHPVFGSGDQMITGEAMEKRLKKLMSFGLKGVEAFYSGFSTKQMEEMLSFADRFGLYVTAGSDYHGRNKTAVLGRSGIVDWQGSIPDGMKRFLKDVQYLS